MAKLIKLTTSYTSCKCQVIAINVDCICTIGFSDYASASYRNTKSCVEYNSGAPEPATIYVQEDVDTIVRLCNND